MRKIDVQDLIQLLGMVGIVGSLVFVGLEMRQSQTIAIAGQQQERAAMFIQRFATFIEAGLYYYEVTINKDLDSLSAEEAGARKNNVFINWTIYENDFYQYQAGLMAEQNWLANLENIRQIYNQCDNRDVYIRYSNFFEGEFRSLVNSFPDQCAG